MKDCVTIKKEINYCEECNFSKTEKVYTADSFEDLRKVYCNKLNRNIHNYLEWNEKCKIPEDCPFRN